VWIGARTDGKLRLRYAYDATRLRSLLPGSFDPNICVPVALDNETLNWVRGHVERPAPGTQLAVWRALKRRMYHYDAGVVAFFGFPRNFLLSTGQWHELLSGRPRSTSAVALDVGAGDGSLNIPLRGSFAKIIATELTTPLVFRLRAAGLDAVLAEELRAEWLGHSGFDAIFILNVLDRCKDPFQMLEHARQLLAPDGWLITSVVLPATQSDAASGSGAQQRRWNVKGGDFETGTASLVNDVFLPAGFEPIRIVRAPYFCAGDSFSPVAALDACVMVLRQKQACDAARASAECSVCDGARLDDVGTK